LLHTRHEVQSEATSGRPRLVTQVTLKCPDQSPREIQAEPCGFRTFLKRLKQTLGIGYAATSIPDPHHHAFALDAGADSELFDVSVFHGS
jgi:hypothetical protein